MNFKDLLFPFGLALLTTFALHHFFFKKSDAPAVGANGVRSGQSFIAPKSKVAYRPLNKEIDFIDEKRRHKTQLTEIETDLARYVFSNDGASLERIEIKRMINGKQSFIPTLFPVGQNERENKCFLIALNEKTPYYYELLGTSETDSAFHIRYRYSSPTSGVNINKTYTIFKETHKLNLTIDVEPKKPLKEGVELRVFYPSPFNSEIPGGPSSIVANEKGAVEKIAGRSINASKGWFQPAMFGGDNKYFIHTMIEDRNAFVQRAYYRDSSPEKIFSILEGPTVDKASSWILSFYFGPKEEIAMARVDDRLEQTLEYAGWLAPLAKLLLRFLKFLYLYIGNYGWAIIILTILMKLCLLPFTMRAEKGMKKNAEYKKKLKYVEQKYKHDKEMLTRAKADLMRKHGLPGLGGCLPLLLQIPLFFALSRVLTSSIEFYKAPFGLWITDLSAKDPYYVLPLFMVIAMLFQAAVSDKSQRFMFIGMAFAVGSGIIMVLSYLVVSR